MGTIWTLARKDLLLAFRDKFGLFWMFGFPLMIALFFGFLSGGSEDRAAMPVAVVDEEQTDASRALVKRLEEKRAPTAPGQKASEQPMLAVTRMTRGEAVKAVQSGSKVAYILIPKGGADGIPFGPAVAPLEVGYDPRRNAEAGFLQGALMETVFTGFQDRFTDPKAYKEQIDKGVKALDDATDLSAAQKTILKSFLSALSDFTKNIDPAVMKPSESGGMMGNQLKMEAITADRARPLSAFEVTFPSAVLWGILQGCMMGFAISIVLERMQGTFLRLQVAPASWGQLLAGKGFACFLACCVVAVVLLLFGNVAFGVRIDPMRLPLLGLAIVCTGVCFAGLMMLVSTLGKTPSGVAGAGVGLMMPMAMLGGGMIPLIAMPGWLLTLSDISPVKWGILALEGAIWRGFGVEQMLLPCGILLAVGAGGFVAGAQILSVRETGRGWLPALPGGR